MNRDQLVALFKACAHLKGRKNSYSVTDDALVEVMLQVGASGFVPIARVKGLELKDDYVKIEAEEHNYLLPISSVLGLKWKEKNETRSSRTGFHA